MSTRKSYTNRLCALGLAYFHPISHTDSKATLVLQDPSPEASSRNTGVRTQGPMLLIQYSGPFGKIQTFGVQPEDNIFRWAYSLCFLSMLINEAAYEA